MSSNAMLTPMMRQYQRIKSSLPREVILLFRLGDFYEMFFEDASRAAPLLGVALTKRQGIPMCGVPYHALDNYLARLIRAGCKAAVCEQVEDPATTKGIVRREVMRVVTPGTVIEDNILESGRHNYLAALYTGGELGLALLDLSTGTFVVESATDAGALTEQLRRYAVSECLVGREQRQEGRLAALDDPRAVGTVTEIEDWTMEPGFARDLLRRHFGVHSLEGFGCEDRPALIAAAGALLHHVREELRHGVEHVRTLQVRHADSFMVLDQATCLNLNLLPDRGQDGCESLLGVLDNTLTPMGKRLLRAWLAQPLREADPINQRLDSVAWLVREREVLRRLRQSLGGVRDMERLISRISSNRCAPRDLNALRASLLAVPLLRELLGEASPALIRGQAGSLHPLSHLTELIKRALVEEPPAVLREGGVIAQGFSAELDELRALATQGRAWLAQFQAREQERTGIKTLKVRHNKVFGFYIEISKAAAADAPPEYERRQTLVNAERFTTPELKERESRILGAHDAAVAMESTLFEEVLNQVAAETAAIQRTATGLAQLDALGSLADRALALDYARPELREDDLLDIRDGRHPVIEQMPDADRFVPNDTLLDGGCNQIMLITGPNMAGKSTYIRQVALIAIMAHIGSFVPARQARIPLLDRVFTRVGAGDDLARGRSTFMVEMQETANILNNATSRSLVILDELGRGTSTFDGISIAWAVVEQLHNSREARPKTLFATHYHELTDLALTLKGVRNYTVQVRERDGSVIFLRRIAQGTADKSYGIHVARLAGMPDAVVARANEVLANLEANELEAGQPKLARRAKRGGTLPDGESAQMSFF